MSVRLGDKIISGDGNGGGGSYILPVASADTLGGIKIGEGLEITSAGILSTTAKGGGTNLFDFKWSDHLLDDGQWIRADDFSWQNGTFYPTAYSHLVNDITEKTLTSETIGSTTIQYYLADDGHKICPDTEENNVEAIYAATGVAWYYIIDTTNERFKLPRTKFGFTGLRDTVGNYVQPGLPNITGTTYAMSDRNSHPSDSGAFSSVQTHVSAGYEGGHTNGDQRTSTFNASSSNSIYGSSTTVQPPATQMYLYFYSREVTKEVIVDYNIGDIFQTLRKDAIDGAVDCDGTLYDASTNIEYQKVIVLLEEGKIPSITLADYATALTADGSVGAFGWDGTGTTSFRVPSLNNVFLETASANNIGSYEEAGLPNITGTVDLTGQSNTTTPLFNSNDVASSALYNNVSIASGRYHTDSASGSGYNRIEIDASRSNSIYGNSTTVQPSAVRMRTMVQLAKPAKIVDNDDVDYVIRTQRPTAQNNYTWYRLYKSGWVEQGGVPTSTSTVTLPIPMADSNYWFIIKFRAASSYSPTFSCFGHTPTTTGFSYDNASASASGFIWRVEGMAAQGE